MPHVDELLGVTTVASAGLLLALALQPADVPASGHVVATIETALATTVAAASEALFAARQPSPEVTR